MAIVDISASSSSSPLEFLQILWKAPGSYQLVVRLGGEAWLLAGDECLELPEPTEPILGIVRLAEQAEDRASLLLERVETTAKPVVRLGRFFGLSDDRLATLLEASAASSDLESQILLGEESPLLRRFPQALQFISPRWSQKSPLFSLLRLLSTSEDAKVLVGIVEDWKASLVGQPPLWLKCRLLKASAHLHRLAGDIGKASFEEDLLRSCLDAVPSDPVKAALLRGCESIDDARGLTTNQPEEAAGPRRIILRCLGSPQIVYGDSSVSAQAWRTQKAISMFFYLALERRRLSSDHLQEVIWPGLGYESGPNFLTTVSRVRKALGTIGLADALVRRQGRLYEVSEAYIVASDKLDFETRARGLGPKTFEIEAARAALELYEGPFLEGLDDQWVVQIRRPLQELWFDLAVRTARAELARGDLERAYRLCGRMLKLEGAREEAHLCQIKTLFAMGRFADAQDAYQSFEKVVKRSTGQPPSAAAQAEYQTDRLSARQSTGR